MSGLSNFLGNVYGEGDEPRDEAASPTSHDDEPMAADTLDDVRESMEALLASTDDVIAEAEQPGDLNPIEELLAADEATPRREDGANDSSLAQFDRAADDDPAPFESFAPADPAATAGPPPAVDDWFASIDEPSAATVDDVDEDDATTTDADGWFNGVDTPPAAATSEGSSSEWFDVLEQSVPTDTPQLPPPAIESDHAAAADVDQPASHPVDPLRIPAAPQPLVSDVELGSFPEPAAVEEDDPWLDRIFDPASEEDDEPADLTPQLPEPQPASVPVSNSGWEPSYDDIIPGQISEAATIRLASADEAVVEAIPTSAERRRQQRGRRGADDASVPLSKVRPKARRRLRRREDDLTTVDLPPPNTDEIVDEVEIPHPTPRAVIIPPPDLANTTPEPEASVKERRRGLLGRRSVDDARNPVQDKAESGARRLFKRRAKDPEPMDQQGLSAAEIMGLDPADDHLWPEQ